VILQVAKSPPFIYSVFVLFPSNIRTPVRVVLKKEIKKRKEKSQKRIKKKREVKEFEGELCCGCLLKVYFHSKLVVIYIAPILYILSTLFHLVDSTVSPPCLATYSSTSNLKPGHLKS
jgi:hypothetical protein